MKRIKLKGVAVAGTSVLLAGGMTMTWAQTQGARTLEEIVVTAQKREQSLQDVPLAITAVDGRALRERGIDNFEDYLRTVPGASFADQGSQGNEVKLRGVGNGTARLSPTTAVYLGEVPVIHTGRSINSSYNFHLVDIERIEVLRGPQGQIYGSNSLGGAIKNVPSKPQFDGLTLGGSVTGASISGGGEIFEGDVTVNLPLTDTFAARVSAYAADREGWYDNVFQGGVRLGSLESVGPPDFGTALPYFPAYANMLYPEVGAYTAPSVAEEDVNDSELTGARVMLRWQPSDTFTADFMYAYEDKETDAQSWAQEIPNVAGPNGLYEVPGTTGFPNFYPSDADDYEMANATQAGNSDEISVFNLVLEWDLGFATLTSSSSYWDRTEKLDTGLPLAGVPAGIAGAFPLIAARDDNPESTIQEFRLTSKDDQRLTWLAGLYYQEIDQDFEIGVEDLSGVDAFVKTFPPPPAPPAQPMSSAGFQTGHFVDEEYALFGEIGYDITEQWNVGFSFRYLELEQTAELTTGGRLYAGTPATPKTKNDTEEFLPKLTVSWTPTEDQLYYASASEGYRSGITNTRVPLSECAPNLAAAGTPGGLAPTDPDTLWNYELGAKLSFMDNRVNLNGAIYYIDWKDLQSQVFLANFAPGNACSYEGILNVGDASIRGFELEAKALLTDQLRLDASFSWTDPEYEDDYAQLNIEKGTTIEGTAEYQTYIGMRYDFNMAQMPAFFRVDWNYIGDIEARPGDFESQPQEHEIGDYHQVNIRGGLDVTENLAVHLWVDNVFDEFGVTRAIDLGGQGNPTYFAIRPMTAGATLRFNF